MDNHYAIEVDYDGHSLTKNEFLKGLASLYYFARPTIFLKNKIKCCGYTYSEQICYGDLQRCGFLRKEYTPAPLGADPMDVGIKWTVIENIKFTDEFGETLSKGTVKIWEK